MTRRIAEIRSSPVTNIQSSVSFRTSSSPPAARGRFGSPRPGRTVFSTPGFTSISKGQNWSISPTITDTHCWTVNSGQLHQSSWTWSLIGPNSGSPNSGPLNLQNSTGKTTKICSADTSAKIRRSGRRSGSASAIRLRAMSDRRSSLVFQARPTANMPSQPTTIANKANSSRASTAHP